MSRLQRHIDRLLAIGDPRFNADTIAVAECLSEVERLREALQEIVLKGDRKASNFAYDALRSPKRGGNTRCRLTPLPRFWVKATAGQFRP